MPRAWADAILGGGAPTAYRDDLVLANPGNPPVPDPIDLHVGARMRELRKSKRMSQDALAQALGITFQQIQKYERAQNRISASMLVKAANVLGVDPASILPERDAKPAPASTLAALSSARGVDELIAGYVQLSINRRRAVLSLVRALIASP